MKKIISVISTLILSMGLMAGVASAQTADACASEADGFYTIQGTGPGSNNTIQCEGNQTVVFTCDNTVLIGNNNQQQADTGAAESDDNTNGGGAGSGDAVNHSETTTDIFASCGPVATATNQETPAPVKPDGQAEDKQAPAPAAPAGAPTADKQVAEAPRGGVNAGAGGSSATSLAAIAGLVASIGAVASGAFLFKKFLV